MHWYDSNQRFPGSLDFTAEKHAQQVEIHVPSEMSTAFDRVENWMRLFGYPNQDLFAVKLALREAVRNALEHGNHSDPAQSVWVTFQVTADEVLLGVEDQGAGFDPQRVPDTRTTAGGSPAGGRGLFLMRAYTTWMHIEPPGNLVILCRLRSHLLTAAPSRVRGSADPEGGLPFTPPQREDKP
jgi:serine/threonine-protein kinase RsbW